ncbi:MAG: DMT family transporter [Magnetovibrionaceae bacterium]
MGPHTNALRPKNVRQGALLTLLAATSFGLTTTAARLAYQGGASTEAVILLRLFVTVPVFFLVALFLRQALAVARRHWGRTLIAAIGMLGTSLALLSAVHYIDVGQAVLVLYTWPLVLVAVTSLRDRKLPPAKVLLGFFAAFGGLVLALGLSEMPINPLGLGLAFLAGVSNVAVFIASTPVLEETDSVPFAAWANCLGIPIMILLMPFLGEHALPQGTVGWSGFVGVSLLYLIAMMALFGALQKGGEQQTALLFNLEPLIAIGAGWALLGETMTALQLLGAVIVVVSLIWARPR